LWYNQVQQTPNFACELVYTDPHCYQPCSYPQAGAEIDSRSLVDGCTPVHEAAKYGNLDILRLFLRHNADTTVLSRSVPFPHHVSPPSNQQRPIDVATPEARKLLEDHQRLDENAAPSPTPSAVSH
jgi:ankyrin repeat protein